MRILHITTAFPENNKETITPWLVKLIQLQKEKGYEVEVFTPSYKDYKTGLYEGIMVWRYSYALSFMQTLTHENTVMNRIKENPLLLFLLPSFFLSAMIYLYKLQRHRKYDIIHIHWHIPLFLFTLPLWHKKVKFITTLYGVEVNLAVKNRIFGFMAKLFKRYIDFYAPISSFTAHLFEKVVGKYKYKVIPYGSALSSKDTDIHTFSGRFLFVGRLVKRKGVHILIEALKDLQDYSWELRIVGKGPESDNLKNMVKEYNLENGIIFEGRVSDERLSQLYKWCDFLILPSYDDKSGDIEGLGVVLLESFSYKKPVIATKWGGVVDIVRDGENGLLAEPSDVDSLRETIEKTFSLSDTDIKNMGENAYNTLKHFSWENIVKEMNDVYQSVMT